MSTEAKLIDDGGPAFPRPASEFTKNGTLSDGNNAVDEQDGMTLRDYFAGKAMAALIIAAVSINSQEQASEKGFSDAAYLIADAMIVARRAKSSPQVTPEAQQEREKRT